MNVFSLMRTENGKALRATGKPVGRSKRQPSNPGVRGVIENRKQGRRIGYFH
jgi:hypothetical protein